MKTPNYKNSQAKFLSLKTPKLEAVPNHYADRDYAVNIEYPEFTCVCPKTGLPDFATIYIEYVPDQKIVELKSLKYYFIAFRNAGIFHENVANRVLDDLVKACQPRRAKVVADFSVRGGVHTTVTAEYPQLSS